MDIIIRGLKFTKHKGGEGSGWFAPPKGTHVADKATFMGLREEYNSSAKDIPFSKDDVRLTAYRVGGIEGERERGIHFAESKESAEQYAYVHPGAKVMEYDISLDKALIAGHQNSVCKQFFNTPYNMMIDKLHKGTDSAGAMRKLDMKIRREALKRGYSGIVYTRPAPPAIMEVVTFMVGSVQIAEQ